MAKECPANMGLHLGWFADNDPGTELVRRGLLGQRELLDSILKKGIPLYTQNAKGEIIRKNPDGTTDVIIARKKPDGDWEFIAAGECHEQ